MKRIGKYTVEEVKEAHDKTIEDPGMHYGSYKGELCGKELNLSSHTLWTFFEKGIKCVNCGVKGQFFALEYINPEEEEIPHLRLYGLKNGEEVLMTKDHIQPQSKGGDDHISNYQTMCKTCNVKKRDRRLQ